MENEETTPKEVFYEQVHMACIQLPRLSSESGPQKSEIFNSIEKKMLQVGLYIFYLDRISNDDWYSLLIVVNH